MRKALALGMLALLAAPAAHADWQTTRWSMTADQVITAAGAKAVAGTEDDQVFDQDLGAEGSSQALGYAFKTRFYFSRAGALTVVREMLANPRDCPALLAKLNETRGRPVEDEPVLSGPSGARMLTKMWVDPASKDRVRYTSSAGMPGAADYCFVVHTPAP